MTVRAGTRRTTPTALYWALVSVLVLFGLVAIFSVGAPFVLLGLTLAAISPWRTCPTVLWPAVASWLGFVVGFLLTAPLSCSFGVGPGMTHPTGRCETLLAVFHYDANAPSLVPPLFVGLVTAAIAGTLTHRLVKRHRERAAATVGP